MNDDDYDYYWAGIRVTWLVNWWRTAPSGEILLVGFMLGLVVACAAFVFGMLQALS